MVAVLSVAGVLAGAVTFRSERRVERGFELAVQPRPPLDEAIDEFEGSRALNPGAARELTEAGLYLRYGRLGAAEERLRRAAELEPENIEAWVKLTRFALARGKPAEARRHWTRARRLDSQLPPGLPAPLAIPESRG
jgi:tetratricopeptide (TPR) repeat protein